MFFISCLRLVLEMAQSVQACVARNDVGSSLASNRNFCLSVAVIIALY